MARVMLIDTNLIYRALLPLPLHTDPHLVVVVGHKGLRVRGYRVGLGHGQGGGGGGGEEEEEGGRRQ